MPFSVNWGRLLALQYIWGPALRWQRRLRPSLESGHQQTTGFAPINQTVGTGLLLCQVLHSSFLGHWEDAAPTSAPERTEVVVCFFAQT